jgi:hypothetical protein
MLERLRISPWTAVALAALVAALSGTAIAGSQDATQSARELTPKKAKRLFNQLIRRRAPRLSVANAGHADQADTATSATTATAAGDAGTVGGLQVKELFFAAPAGSQEVELFSGGGLVINASCAGTVDQGPELSAVATGVPEGAFKFVGRGFSPGNEIAIDEFGLNNGDGPVNLDANEDRGTAQLTFIREDGATVTGIISWDDGVRTARDLCGVSGTLTVG